MQEPNAKHSGKKFNSQCSGAELFTPRHGRAFPWVLCPHCPGLRLLRLQVAVDPVLITLNVRLEDRGARVSTGPQLQGKVSLQKRHTKD